jgi:hypothetical protein
MQSSRIILHQLPAYTLGGVAAGRGGVFIYLFIYQVGTEDCSVHLCLFWDVVLRN